MDRAVGAGGPWTTADFKHGVRICSSVWGDALTEMLFAIVQRFRLNMSAEGAIRSGVLALSSEGAVASQPGAQHRRCAAPGDAGACRCVYEAIWLPRQNVMFKARKFRLEMPMQRPAAARGAVPGGQRLWVAAAERAGAEANDSITYQRLSCTAVRRTARARVCTFVVVGRARGIDA